MLAIIHQIMSQAYFLTLAKISIKLTIPNNSSEGFDGWQRFAEIRSNKPLRNFLYEKSFSGRLTGITLSPNSHQQFQK